MGGNPFARTQRRAGQGRKPLSGAKRHARPQPPFDPERAIAGFDDLPAGARLVLPWPPTELSPNARVHHRRRAAVVKTYRQDCWAWARQQLGCGAGPRLFPGAGLIGVRLDFFPPDRRARDDDNCEAAFKAGRDGVAAALAVDDRRFVVTRRLRLEPRGCVVMTFTALRQAQDDGG